MEDRSSDKREDKIRVIEEPVEEVVRLDVAKIEPICRKKKRGDIGLMPRVIEPEEELGQQEEEKKEQEEVASRKAIVDPERDWLEDKGGKGILDVPIGWFVLVGAGLMGVLVWAVFQTAIIGDDAGQSSVDAEGKQSGAAGDNGLVDEMKRADAAKHFAEMEKLVASFLKAETLEEKAKFVRHPKRVLPLMRKYYKTNEVKSLVFKETIEYHVAALNQRPFIALSVELEGGGFIPVLLEDHADGLMVDWESYVCYQPIDPEKYIKERPTEQYSLRVYAKVDHFYTYEFSDEQQFDCYRLTFRGSEKSLYGYVKQGSESAKEFLGVFPDRTSKKQHPLILKVRFLEGGKASKSVLIEGVESKLWAFADDPDEVATEVELE